jgi:SAM-dependent methyltransferase
MSQGTRSDQEPQQQLAGHRPGSAAETEAPADVRRGRRWRPPSRRQRTGGHQHQPGHEDEDERRQSRNEIGIELIILSTTVAGSIAAGSLTDAVQSALEAFAAGALALVFTQNTFTRRALRRATRESGHLVSRIESVTEDLDQRGAETWRTLRGQTEQVISALGQARDETATATARLTGLIDQARLILDTANSSLGVPEMTTFSDRVGSELRVGFQNRLTTAFREQREAWREQSQRLAVGEDPDVLFGWEALISNFAGSVARNIGGGDGLPATARMYTKLVIECCQEFAQRPDGPVGVLLVTGMLPEEFWNWPHTERAPGRVRPAHLAHAWVGAPERTYRRQIEALRDTFVFRRCVLVSPQFRQPGNGRHIDATASLRTYLRLKESAGMAIRPDIQSSYQQLRASRLGCLWPTITGQSHIDFDSAERLSNIDKMRFYAVGPTERFEEASYERMDKLRPLVDEFVTSLHSTPDDARFCVVPPINTPVHDGFLRHTFMPEYAIFLRQPARPGQISAADVAFAIEGQTVPFTEAMRVRFIAGDELASFAEAVEAVWDFSVPMQNLSATLAEPATPNRLVTVRDRLYQKAETDTVPTWLEGDPADLNDYVDWLNTPWKQTNSVLYVGCGRGRGLLRLIRSQPGLNRPEVRVMGIDVSGEAVLQAREALERIKEESRARPDGRLADGLEPLRASVEFVHGDVASDAFPVGEGFDLVIDWLSFAELWVPAWDDYLQRLPKLCRRDLILKVFAKEGADRGFIRSELPGVARHMFSREEVSWLLSDAFALEPDATRNIPAERVGDQVVVPRQRVYFLRRTTGRAGA